MKTQTDLRKVNKKEAKQYLGWIAEEILDKVEDDVGIYFVGPIHDKAIRSIRDTVIYQLECMCLALAEE
jgi:hypothetical protein